MEFTRYKPMEKEPKEEQNTQLKDINTNKNHNREEWTKQAVELYRTLAETYPQHLKREYMSKFTEELIKERKE